jgi:hypothetical protein
MDCFKYIIIFLCIFFGAEAPSIAAVNLNVMPSDGSPDLRFGHIFTGIENNKQIRVRIISTDGKPYQVFQRIQGPLLNEKGESLNLQAIKTVTLGNSNASGTLYMQNTQEVSYGDQLVYSSGRGGESDSFMIGYSVMPDMLNSSGTFSSKLVFTARSTGDAAQDQAFVTISLESASNWKASVTGGHAQEDVRVREDDTTEKTADFVKIAFSGNAGSEVRIYQSVDALPQDTTGQEIQSDTLRYTVAGESAENIPVQGRTGLGRTRTLIYSSQKPEENLQVYFMVDPDMVQHTDAGSYSGKVRYSIETDKERVDYVVGLTCQIQSIFTMDVTVPAEGVRFAKVLPTNPPEERVITVDVRSNLRRPYQVLQNVQTPMTNEKGKEIDKEAFRIKIEIPEGQRGRTRFTEFTPVETGEYPIFSSDAQGHTASFKVVYRMQANLQMAPGNYAAPVRFSLNEN